MIHLRSSLLASIALVVLGCGRGAGGERGAPSASASGAPQAPASGAPAGSGTAAGPVTTAAASAVPLDPPSPASPPSSFVGAKSEKACKAQTVELATYQSRGELSLGGGADAVGATWRLKLSGKPQEQVAFSAHDQEGRRVAAPRGVGMTTKDITPLVFASGPSWTVVWFDEKGLAFARPHAETLPLPEVAHVGAIGPEVAADVALSSSPTGAVLATTPFGAGRSQLGLFLFAPPDAMSSVKALGVTHHGKEPHRSAVAAGPSSIFVVWDEGGALVASRFDAAGKETGSPCTVAPAGEKRERVAIAATGAGATVLWTEGSRVRTRVLDAAGCPASPIWTVAEGRWAVLASLGDAALAGWVASDGRLLAARLQPTGAPPERGVEVSEGSGGVKDPPSVVSFGTGKVAFGYAEPMSPVIKTKRLAMRILDAACIP